MNRECSFNTNTVRVLTYCKCFTNTATTFFNYKTFKQLNTFTIAFFNLYVYFYSITRTKFRAFF